MWTRLHTQGWLTKAEPLKDKSLTIIVSFAQPWWYFVLDVSLRPRKLVGVQVMVLSQDKERGRVTLSTKKLEPSPGDMLRDPQRVFENAEAMAESFRKRVEAAELSARSDPNAAMANPMAAVLEPGELNPALSSVDYQPAADPAAGEQFNF